MKVEVKKRFKLSGPQQPVTEVVKVNSFDLQKYSVYL